MIRYIAGPQSSPLRALAAAQRVQCARPILLRRRGIRLGWIARPQTSTPALTLPAIRQRWERGEATLLPGAIHSALTDYRPFLRQTNRYARNLAQGSDPAQLLSRAPYAARLAGHFDMLGSYSRVDDMQEIATVEFDALRNNRVISDNIWMKAAWLSFDQSNASLRLRFSFGIADIDDVSRDLKRQRCAAHLAQTLFPECGLITQNVTLIRRLAAILQARQLEFLERIVYFNAPNGGAQFHHDVERGHRGVVFAQLTGRTVWLAAPKPLLATEILRFCAVSPKTTWQSYFPSLAAARKLQQYARTQRSIERYFNEPDHEPLDHLLNRVPEFTRQLIDRGMGFLLQPGDVLLLPQQDIQHCCWHSVFCAGTTVGQALSFAIRSE